MAKSKALIAAEARLSIARQVYINQRARIAELESLLATRGHIATPCAEAAPVVSRFTRRDGSVWEKTRLGNQTRSRCVQPAIILGAQHAC